MSKPLKERRLISFYNPSILAQVIVKTLKREKTNDDDNYDDNDDDNNDDDDNDDA